MGFFSSLHYQMTFLRILHDYCMLGTLPFICTFSAFYPIFLPFCLIFLPYTYFSAFYPIFQSCNTLSFFCLLSYSFCLLTLCLLLLHLDFSGSFYKYHLPFCRVFTWVFYNIGRKFEIRRFVCIAFQ